MTVEFEYSLDDAKRNARQLLGYFCRRLIIPIVLLVVMGVGLIVLNVTEFTDDKVGLYLGCVVLGCAVFATIMFVAVYFLTMKNTEKAFAVYGADGKERFSIEYNDGFYIFSNLSKGNVTRYSQTDVVSVKPYKGLLMIKLASKELMILPNQPRVCEIFESFLTKKK